MALSEGVKKIVHNYNKDIASAKWECLKQIANLEKSGDINEEELSFVLRSLNPAHVTTKRSNQISRYSIGASLRISLVHYILEKSFYKEKKLISPGANDKLVDGRFLSKLGYPVPKVLSENASVQETESYNDCIVKAKVGAASKGVFKKKNNIYYHFFDKKEYTNEEFVEYAAMQKFNRFIVEEYIGGVGSVKDIKFYMFYGEVGVVLEVERGEGGNQHCFYDSQARRVDTGRYQQTSFYGTGFDSSIKICAEEISKLIPSPFVRVDFIVNGSDFKVGELTAHPGGFEDFDKEWDFFLGEKFIEARARLMEDLLNGKKFDEYLKRYE